ncbi:MAG: OsmC family protein [Gemmatales bacterium]
MICATTVKGSIRSEWSNGIQSSMADVPVEKGGEGKGFGPHELLEAALATCMVITVRKVADQRQISLESARCEVRLDRSLPETVTFEYSLHLHGELSPEQEALLFEAASRCPVKKTLGGGINFKPVV